MPANNVVLLLFLGSIFCFALLFLLLLLKARFQLHEKRALLLFIDLCAGIDFSSDDIYPHFLFAFRAIHRETKRQCILINLCFRLIVANRAINPYRFCGTFICQTVCSFFGAAFYYKHLRFCFLRTQCTHILIYVSIENRTTRHNAPCPGRIAPGQGTGG